MYSILSLSFWWLNVHVFMYLPYIQKLKKFRNVMTKILLSNKNRMYSLDTGNMCQSIVSSGQMLAS
jgi:hypothetical protein